jgi:carbon storage regulator
MLVITRREGEEVVIGDPNNPIGVVRIASIKGDRVRIAFDFPRAIDVHRREVANQIIAGGDAAAPHSPHAPAAHAETNGHATPNGHPPLNGEITIVVASAPVTK